MNAFQQKGYLGEFPVQCKILPYDDYTSAEWILHWIGMYGQFDGAHHKAWVLDQIARIVNGTPVIIKEARWDDGTTVLRFYLDEPTQAYRDWVQSMRGEYSKEYEEYEYEYDEGIPP